MSIKGDYTKARGFDWMDSKKTEQLALPQHEKNPSTRCFLLCELRCTNSVALSSSDVYESSM